MTLSAELRQRASNFAVDAGFRALSRGARLHPLADPAAHGVRVVTDVPYAPPGDEAHRLDVYVPPAEGPHPVLLYLHGGGFRILSKDTHWVMALSYARAGYLVFNANYRLAPRHPFPAAIEDACVAYRWVLDHAETYGGDIRDLTLSGESAGANLALGVTLAATTKRSEPYARAVFERGRAPSALVPLCGLFQVRDMDRFRRWGVGSMVARDRMRVVGESYVGSSLSPPEPDLADPVVCLERGSPMARPFPPTFISVGSRDPILDDSRRLHHELARRGADAEIEEYEGQGHAFQALLWRAAARRSWEDVHAFLDARRALRETNAPTAPTSDRASRSEE